MGLAEALQAATQPATRPRRVADEILPELNDADRAALLDALRSTMSPARIVAALKAQGIGCSEGSIRYWRSNDAG